MKSTRYIGRLYPGLVLLLIDQSSDTNTNTISQFVQDSIVEMIERCTMIDEYGNYGVHRQIFVMAIGYGSNEGSAAVLRDGWVDTWADKYLDNPIIPLFEQGKPLLSEALSFTKGIVIDWLKTQKEHQEYGNLWGEDDDGFLAPITIINFTTGGIDEDLFKIMDAANGIMRQQNTWLYHILIPNTDKESELVFPNCLEDFIGHPYKREGELLFEISSKLPKIEESWSELNIEKIIKGCRGICITSDCRIIKTIIGIQCREGMGRWGRPMDWMDMY